MSLEVNKINMKKRKSSAIKLFFLFATLGAFPFLYPAMQFQTQNMGRVYVRSFEVSLSDRIAPMPKNPVLAMTVLEPKNSPEKALSPINPALGSEVQPDSIE